SRITYRTNPSFATNHARTYSRRFPSPETYRRMEIRWIGRSAVGTMCAQYSNNVRSRQSSRSSSATRNRRPSRLNRTSCSVRATAEVGSIWTSPRRRTTSSIDAGRGASRSWPITARCRAFRRETPTGSIIEVDKVIEARRLPPEADRPPGEPFCHLVRTPTEYRAESEDRRPGIRCSAHGGVRRPRGARCRHALRPVRIADLRARRGDVGQPPGGPGSGAGHLRETVADRGTIRPTTWASGDVGPAHRPVARDRQPTAPCPRIPFAAGDRGPTGRRPRTPAR